MTLFDILIVCVVFLLAGFFFTLTIVFVLFPMVIEAFVRFWTGKGGE